MNLFEIWLCALTRLFGEIWTIVNLFKQIDWFNRTKSHIHSSYNKQIDFVARVLVIKLYFSLKILLLSLLKLSVKEFFLIIRYLFVRYMQLFYNFFKNYRLSIKKKIKLNCHVIKKNVTLIIQTSNVQAYQSSLQSN